MSPRVTVHSVQVSNHLDYLVVPASHSNKPGCEALAGAFFDFLLSFIFFSPSSLDYHLICLKLWKPAQEKQEKLTLPVRNIQIGFIVELY